MSRIDYAAFLMSRMVPLLQAAISWPSLALATVTAGFSLYNLSERGMTPGVNAWDLVVPYLANLQLTPLLLAVLWAPVVIAQHRRLLREEVLLRHGTWRSAVRCVLGADLAAVAGAILLSLAVALAIAAPRGLDGEWSAYTRHVLETGGMDTEVSASAAAQYLDSPWVWMALQVSWLLLGILGIATLHVCVLLLVGAKQAHVALAVIVVFGVLAGAGIFGVRSFPDTSAWTNLLWALDGPAGVALSLAAWLLCFSMLALGVAIKDGRADPTATRRLLPMAAAAGSVLLLVLFAWSSLPKDGPIVPRSALEAAFGGQYSSLVGHVLAALPAIAAATVVASRLDALGGDRLAHVLLRRGSVPRWLGPAGVRAAGLLGGTAVTAVGAVCLLGNATAESGAPGLEAADVVRLTLSYALFALTLAVLALGLFWVRGHLREWPLVVLGVLALGYPVVLPASRLNPFSAYSLVPGDPLHTSGLVAQGILLLVLTAATAAFMTRSRLPLSL